MPSPPNSVDAGDGAKSISFLASAADGDGAPPPFIIGTLVSATEPCDIREPFRVSIFSDHRRCCDAALSRVLGTNKTLTSLNLWRCGVQPVGGEELAQGLLANDTLVFLDVGTNNIVGADKRRIVDKLEVTTISPWFPPARS